MYKCPSKVVTDKGKRLSPHGLGSGCLGRCIRAIWAIPGKGITTAFSPGDDGPEREWFAGLRWAKCKGRRKLTIDQGSSYQWIEGQKPRQDDKSSTTSVLGQAEPASCLGISPHPPINTASHPRSHSTTPRALSCPVELSALRHSQP